MENSRSLHELTTETIIGMIERRAAVLTEQWDAGEKGTYDSGRLLSAIEELIDLKWEIIDVRESVPRDQISP